MGCSCSSESEANPNTEFISHSDFDHLLKGFHHPEKFNDQYEIFPTLKTLEIVECKEIPGYKMLICQNTDSQHKLDEYLDFWTGKYNDFNHPNLLMIHSMSIISYSQLVVPLKKSSFLLDFPTQVLGYSSWINKDQPLPEPEIWYILDCLIAALAYEQGQKVRCSNLTLNDIFTVRTYFGLDVYKISDCFCKPFSTFGYQQLIESERNGKFDKHIQRQINLSPIQLHCARYRIKYPNQNLYKSQVFILGMLCLYCLDLVQNIDVYDWESYEIRADILEQRLTQLNKSCKVSLPLLQMIEKMLLIDEYMRPDFTELNTQVFHYYHQVQKDRLLEVLDPSDFIYGPFVSQELCEHVREKASRYSKLEFTDFLRRPEDLNYKFSLGTMASSIELEKHPRKQEKLISEPFEVENIVSPVPQAKVVNEEMSDTYKLSNSEFTNNQISKNSIGFALYPFPISNSKSIQSPFSGSPRDPMENRVGRIDYSTGQFYLGHIAQNKRSGVGIHYDQNGDKLVEGEWENDMPNGTAVFFNRPYLETPITHRVIDEFQWIKYDGNVKNGNKHGKGILFFYNGDVFDGVFFNDTVLVHLNGYYQYSDGRYIEGLWNHGKFISQ